MFSLTVHAIKWHFCTPFKSFFPDKRCGTPRQTDPVLSGSDACRCRQHEQRLTEGASSTSDPQVSYPQPHTSPRMHCSKRELCRKCTGYNIRRALDRWGPSLSSWWVTQSHSTHTGFGFWNPALSAPVVPAQPVHSQCKGQWNCFKNASQLLAIASNPLP